MRKTALSLLMVLLLAGGVANGTDRPVLFHMLDQETGLPDINVRSLFMLPDGRMAIRTSSYLSIYDGTMCRNFQWDPSVVPYMEYSGESGMSYHEESGLIILRSIGRRWAFDTASESFIYDNIPAPREEASGIPLQPDSGSSRTMTVTSADGKLWSLSDKKVVSYNPVNGELREIERIPADSDDLFTAIAIDTEGKAWIGTARSGIRIVSTDGSIFRLPYLQTVEGTRVYPHTDIAFIYADTFGGVWIATQSEGLLYTHPDILRFRTVNNSTLVAGNMQDQGVKCMVEEPGGNVLVGTVRGLVRYNPSANTVTVPWKELRNALVISLFTDADERIWVGTFYDGLYCIEKSGRIRHYTWPEDGNVDVSYKTGTANRNCVRALLQSSDGSFWISVYGGAGRFNPSDGTVSLLSSEHKELESIRIIRTLELADGGILEGSGDNGFFRYDTVSSSVLEVSPINPDLTPDGRILSRVTDNDSNLWYTTFSRVGLLRAGAPEGTAPLMFGPEYGVECGAFLENSVLKHSDGTLWFGGASGFVIIDPSRAALPDYGIAPRVSTVSVGGEIRKPENNRIVINYDEYDLKLSFSNLNYANPSLSEYRYRLDGHDGKWRALITGLHPEVAYSSLAPGKYVFEVSASNNGIDWSTPTGLEIEVKPPFYATRLAYLLYVLLGILILILVFQVLYRRQERKLQESADAERHRQEKELTEMKLRFFTNISHELRTPISLILLPLESIMKEKDKGSAEYGKLDTMHRNAKSLLDIVNHLLDFRKLEMGGEKIHLGKGNFVEFASSVVDSFRSAAAEKGVGLEFIDDTDNPLISFDKGMMQKVLNNLLSNALKFTPEGGSVKVAVSQEEESLRVEVSDTGVGIPNKDLPDIFEHFFRSSNAEATTGSGIGLSLVKQYVEMHKGSVGVSSEEGHGANFWFVIPFDPEGEEAAEEEKKTADSSSKRILVVDDNADFRNYLLDELSPLYSVTAVASGEEALKRIPSVSPDIVVSDVMMPGISGIELTSRIKEDVETSHIPVILLTARTSEDVRTEGYTEGADAYLTKPFLMEQLLARIKNLLEEREKRIKSFSSRADVSPMHVTITTVDQKLMARIMDFLEKNMDNTEYSVEELASDVGMHRMNLYRKIQSLYGMTPSEFIRTMRLKRAAQLLTDDPNLNVSEVADMVGFNTPKYFTKYFKEFFGVLPSQYNKK